MSFKVFATKDFLEVGGKIIPGELVPLGSVRAMLASEVALLFRTRLEFDLQAKDIVLVPFLPWGFAVKVVGKKSDGSYDDVGLGINGLIRGLQDFNPSNLDEYFGDKEPEEF